MTKSFSPRTHPTLPGRAPIAAIRRDLHRHDAPPIDREERASRDPRDNDQPAPEMIRAGLRRTALVPAIVTVPCPTHGADVGVYCFSTAHGVCAERIIARAAKR